jgi:hypothetical protein
MGTSDGFEIIYGDFGDEHIDGPKTKLIIIIK